MSPPIPALAHSLPATGSRRPSVLVRVLAVGATAWSAAFAVVNLWVQAAVIDTDGALAHHLLGLGLLNTVAIVLKLLGIAIVVAAVRPWGERHAGPLTALLTGAVATLALWGTAAAVALGASGGAPTAAQSFADGVLTVPGWTYPTFFLVGAVTFAGPARHIAQLAPSPRRWVMAGALLVPLAVMTTIAATAQLLIATGLLP